MTHSFPTRRASGLVGSNRGTFRSLGRLNFSAFRWRFFASGCDASRTLAFLAGDRGNDGANLYISSAFRDQNFRDNPFIDRFKFHGCLVSLDLRQNIAGGRSEEHTSELQSLMRISYAVFCLKKK